MREVWLKGNRRIVWVAAGAVALSTLFGVGVLAWLWPRLGLIGQGVGIAVLASSLFVDVFVALMWATPRLAFNGREMLAYLRGNKPIPVPIEIVECFLLGHGPSLLPGEKHARTETSTLVIKLADRAEEWSHVEVDPRLAAWCDGYITIRGTWTEPLDVQVVHRLNERLAAVARGRSTP
jgi:hypothetical protein